jgi:H+/Cl- antiporter ClcA
LKLLPRNSFTVANLDSLSYYYTYILAFTHMYAYYFKSHVCFLNSKMIYYKTKICTATARWEREHYQHTRSTIYFLPNHDPFPPPWWQPPFWLCVVIVSCLLVINTTVYRLLLFLRGRGINGIILHVLLTSSFLCLTLCA